MNKQKKEYNNKGITLIALIVTVVLMIILAGVTISTVIDDRIFEYTENAVDLAQDAENKEQELKNEVMDNYFNPTSNDNPYETAQRDADGYLLDNATYTSGGYTAVIPAGFKVSETAGEKEITTGLVIKDANENEFVWIPVTKKLGQSYSFSNTVTEPALVSEADITVSLETLKSEYAQMVNRVNEYKGFYIGRYETTYDGDGAGSVYGGTISNDNVWVNLYNKQKETTYVTGNGINVQTAMIYGVLWDETLAFMEANDSNFNKDVALSSATIYTGETTLSKYAGVENTNDIVLNIWGMGSSFCEWTQEVAKNGTRIVRGTDRIRFGVNNAKYYANARNIHGTNGYGSFYYTRNKIRLYRHLCWF